ncbi:hypothetical protein ACM64Y_15425 [Novispirillum sp. DQ9]|uniref:hypothetical protein n=1 Tax=Novispirillum sp. DQ9 TaxID=3398612 RepID=UPI003C7D2712
MLLLHRCRPRDVEAYGDMLTCPHGHYQLWESWRAGPDAPPGVQRVVGDHEYEEWPRGRVVFDTAQQRFIVFSDGQVYRHRLHDAVAEAFGLPKEGTRFLRDAHYANSAPLSGGQVAERMEVLGNDGMGNGGQRA